MPAGEGRREATCVGPKRFLVHALLYLTNVKRSDDVVDFVAWMLEHHYGQPELARFIRELRVFDNAVIVHVASYIDRRARYRKPITADELRQIVAMYYNPRGTAARARG